ncbi:acetyl-CoA C-acyltransferase [Ancrocorticia sp.]|uniref:acetyl-CoA C-acyltransferase n=1 Tax=Ancrocorticia sp. TaxID=2593684 RepID=UPI003F905AC9
MAFESNDALIVTTLRSPISRARKGSLTSVRPDDLLHQVLSNVLATVPTDAAHEIEDLIVGCAEPHDEHGANIARSVAVLMGRDDVPGTTVNRFCASSIQATRNAFHGIRAGEGDTYLIGGVECVSRYQVPSTVTNHPLYREAAERAMDKVKSRSWSDPREDGHMPNYHLPMGLTAELVAQKTNTTREEQDRYAAQSQQRAAVAQADGFMAKEITPITTPDGQVVKEDDGLRPNTTAENLAELPPAFVEDGTVTAGNACPLNDGAAGALVMSGRKVDELGIQPRARIVASAVTALTPELMGLGPIKASRRAMKRAGLTAEDLDAVELNEAFAAQVVPTILELGLKEEIVNPHGGAIALGHPFGATGVRMLGTLINDLDAVAGRFGLATLCVGGGQGMAVVIERL